jgi:flagellar biosynthesis chaperone FliJ
VHVEVARALGGAGATGAEVARWGAWGQALAAREAGLAVEGIHLAEAILRGREELVARRQEERKLERLREKALVRAQAEDIRQEALLLDDLALRRQDGKGSGR